MSSTRAESIRSLLDDEALAEILPPTLQTTYGSMREFTAAIITALADHAEWRDQPATAPRPTEAEGGEAL